MIARPQAIVLAVAAVSAVAMPLLLLLPPAAPQRRVQPSLPPLSVAAEPPLVRVFDRPLFAASAGDAAALPPDAPQLTGIVGRLGSDAVAMVRTAQGQNRTLTIGDSIDGWKLESLAIDAALFSRGGQQARVPLPAADPEPAAQ
ncbi:hypothetical protein [Sphingomonas pokkalii]|uniref:General secretion pathway protein GspN n=1 Tax=Sphingomonas pokkalii TaxID=2175090 RepID=A0A2U0SGM0_9SPHN|nr:hypothetical protein [Sphingomonas pokkalii]PVX30455.1 hypothetical protein DD559_14795 [Sphingomonas pokkalii]